jgi:hypothetical protein
MSMFHARLAISVAVIGLLPAAAAAAETPFSFSTGDPDGKMATAARPDTGGKFEIESADDFILDAMTAITGASFTGLLAGTSLSSIGDARVEIYRVFPKDSGIGRTSGPPTFSTPQAPTRVNSPRPLSAADCAAPFVSFPPPERRASGQAQIATAPFRRQSLDRVEIPADAEARRFAGFSVAVVDPHRLGR